MLIRTLPFGIVGGTDKYLSGMACEDMTVGEAFSAPDEDDRRYQI